MSVLSYNLSTLPIELWQHHIIPALNKSSLLALNRTCKNFHDGPQLFLHTSWKIGSDKIEKSLCHAVTDCCQPPDYMNMNKVIEDMFSVVMTGEYIILDYHRNKNKRWQRSIYHKVAEYFGLVSRTVDTGLTYSYLILGYNNRKNKYTAKVQIIDDYKVIIARRLCDIPPSTVLKTRNKKKVYCDALATASTRTEIKNKAYEILEKTINDEYVRYYYDSDSD